MRGYPLDGCLFSGLLEGMESGSKVVEVLVSEVWESWGDGESIGEDDHLGVNGPIFQIASL